MDVFSFKTGEIEDLPSHSPVYEELVEVVTQTVAKLSIDTTLKSRLDKFLDNWTFPVK